MSGEDTEQHIPTDVGPVFETVELNIIEDIPVNDNDADTEVFELTTTPQWRYNEDEFISEFMTYLQSTYGQHYAHDVNDRGMQLFDLWEGLGSLDTTARDTAIKYLTRYGRKGGFNKKDLFKVIHYTLLLAYATRDKQQWV